MEEAKEYCRQLNEATVYYGNVMDLPYCTEYAFPMRHPLHDEAVFLQDSSLLYTVFSKLGILAPKERDKRKEIYEKSLNDADYLMNLLNNVKPKQTTAIEDAIEGVINAEE